MRREAMTPHPRHGYAPEERHGAPRARRHGEGRAVAQEAIPRPAVSATVSWGHPCPVTARKESAMLLEQVLYQAQVTATGGREGRALSSDGVLDVQLTTPRVLG